MTTGTNNPNYVPGTLRDGIYIKNVPSHYNPSQVSEWLSSIGFALEFGNIDSFTPSLNNLAHLMRLHLLTFPFENTVMHYTPHHIMDVSHEGAFNRLVIERQGSYCFGQNGVFLEMLRGLGFRAYSGAARVNTTPEAFGSPNFTSLSHMVIFVQPFEDSNETYLVDVGFGSSGLVRPILLSDSPSNIIMGTNPTEKHRLTRSPHLSSSLGSLSAGSRWDSNWNLEVWHSSDDKVEVPWSLLVSFSENEYFPIDYQNWSFVISTKPEGIFWENVLCLKYGLLNEADGLSAEEKHKVDLELNHNPAEVSKYFMYKYVMVGNRVKRYIGGSSTTIRTLTTEMERISALREIFGLDVPGDAAVHMSGRAPSLG